MMLSIETLALFYLTAVLLALAPGPDNAFVLMQALTHGQRQGLLVVLGLCSGLLVHSALSLLGLSALLLGTPWAMHAVSALGAAYLLCLALGAWCSSASHAQAALLTNAQAYRRGIVMNLSNPKVSLFFIAYLPQFTQAERGHVSLQLLLLCVVFIIAAGMVMSGIALFAGRAKSWLTAQHQRWLQRLTALVLLLLALNLLRGLFL